LYSKHRKRVPHRITDINGVDRRLPAVRIDGGRLVWVGDLRQEKLRRAVRVAHLPEAGQDEYERHGELHGRHLD